MGKDVDVDENGFIASGALLARHGQLPYRDYHYNHMPTEVFVYAALFRLTDHLLLVARVFQSVCAAGAATALFATAYGAAESFKRRRRLAFAWAIGLLLLTNPLFFKTAGISWNHDFPLLMALLGFLALRRGLRQGRSFVLTACSGFLLAMAATSRLTFLPIAAAFILLVFLDPGQSVHRRAGLLGSFAAGFLIASLPSLWVWSRSWQNAFFGNFLYPRLNTEIHEQRDEHALFTLLPILAYYLRSWFTLPGNGVITLAFLGLAAAKLRRGRWRHDARQAELLSIAAIAGLLIASGFMPAPPYPQYFYAATPFMILGLALMLAGGDGAPFQRKTWGLMTAAFVFCVVFGAPAYYRLWRLPSPSRWVPIQAHQIGNEIAGRLDPGIVLTLEPLFPLEGGMDTDARFATGRFGIRVADLLTPSQRRQYLMPAAHELGQVVEEDSPSAILIVRGSDAAGERGLIAAALAHHYVPIVLASPGGHGQPHARAWVRPRRLNGPEKAEVAGQKPQGDLDYSPSPPYFDRKVLH